MNNHWKNALAQIKKSYINLAEGQKNTEVEHFLARVHPHAMVKETNPFYKKSRVIKKASKGISTYKVTKDGVEINVNS